MTTFQDPQPLSRRAARQSERGEGTAVPASFTEFPAQPAAAAPVASVVPIAATPQPEPVVTGRRAQLASPPPPAAESPNYQSPNVVTASRPPSAPSYEPQAFRSRLDAREAQQPIVPEPQGDQGFRVRDFSPEGARVEHGTGRVAPPAWASAAPPADLGYQTEAREDSSFPVAPAAPISQVPQQYAAPPIIVVPPSAAQPVAFPAAPAFLRPQESAPAAAPVPAAATHDDAEPQVLRPEFNEQTLSRREFRALMAQQTESAVQHAGVTDDSLQNAPAGWNFPAAEAPIAEPAIAEAPVAAAAAAPFSWSQLQPAEPLAAQLAREQIVVESAVVEEPAAWRPPVGHWSTMADVDDDEIETTINRRVGSGSSATHALVLPAIPLGSDIRGPLTSTGEVMLTGSIDLPHTLSSTGASGQMEHAGIDSLFELNDHEVISTDSQPVRAIKAVSTHQNGHGVTHTQRPKGTRLLTVLLISASSLAVVVAGLLVAAFVFKIF